MFFLLKNKSFLLKSFLLIVTIAVILAGLAFSQLKKQPPDFTKLIEEQITINDQQKLRILRKGNPKKGLLIYITQGRNNTTEEYAKKFSELSYYVGIVDNQALLNSTTNQNSHCLNIAEKLSDISSQMQTHLSLNTDDLPILVGTDESAASIYVALAQASEHKFHAAVGINFSTAIDAHSPLCEQETFSQANEEKKSQLIPVKRLPTSFYIFQNKELNSSLADAKFAEKVSNIKLTVTDDKKQSAQAEAIQILQWLDPRLVDQISSDSSDSDLPLIEVGVDLAQLSKKTDSLAIILTGDGGWAEIDKNIAKILAEKGVPTVALDSLSYFWKVRTPEETAKDVEAIISQYLEKWNKKKVILIGYSFGADVLPLVANNLNTDIQGKISLIALLGMGKTAAFEFRLSSWMNADTNPNRIPILPAIEKMKWANSICIYGIDDDAANCLPTEQLGVKIISMPGDHHFDEKYDVLVQHILENEKRD